jgi:hypothetical protein
MRTIFYATSVTLLIAAAACSDNKSTTDAGPGGQLCPTTIVQATSTSGTAEGTSNKCHVDQYICVVGFQCGNFTQQATCTCDGTTGSFACVLSNGTAVQSDVQDGDIAGLCAKLTNPTPEACPTDKTTATTTPCKNAGQQCYYSTTCTNPPRTDVCQCVANQSGDAGLSWKCDLNSCP